DDFDVLADGAVVGRIFKVHAAPEGSPWMWTLAFGYHEDRTPTHGYEPTREAAMAAFAKTWRRERRPVPDEQISRWNQQRGPRVGGWCDTKDEGLYGLGGVRGGRIRLASLSGRLSLGSEGVTYFRICIDDPPIPTSPLLKPPERSPGALRHPHF